MTLFRPQGAPKEECVGFVDLAALPEHEFGDSGENSTTKRQSSTSAVTHLATPRSGRAGGR
jgi:hypothetical protein